MAWMVTGCLYVVGLFAALDHQGITDWYIGRLVQLNSGIVLGIAAGLTIAMFLIRGRLHRSAAGLLAGCGVTCLWLAYLNRDGPGLVYRAAGPALESVTRESNWRIWLLTGLALIAVGITLGLSKLTGDSRSGSSRGT